MIAVDFSKYNDTLRRLSHEAIACAPEVWNQGRLIIDFDGSALHYRMESDSNQTPAALTQQLARFCGELFILMEMDGQQWSQCVISFSKTPEDSWDFNVKFSYPES
jgi:hypothetical protein